jgi:exodeoxyribonuclease VII large subunit
VSDLTLRVRAAIERDLAHLYVRGELSNFRVVGSGHGYGTLKDDRSQIRLAIFRNTLGVLGFVPENGRTYVAGGRVGVYEARGEYQIVCESLVPDGEGAAAVALRQLRERLAAEGLFDRERKRPLPFLPRTIGVATSPTGAAIRDVLRVLDRRFTNLRVVVSPCKVQGADAPLEIVAALRALEAVRGLDLILLTRGGGSAEDLSAFNDERVVRAIASAPVPVISAVGHEIDWTLADLVADLRCSTPSAAAEMVVREKAALAEQVGALGLRLAAAARDLLGDLRARAQAIARRLVHPRRRLQEIAQRLDDLGERLRRASARALADSRRRMAVASARLALRSPGARVVEEHARVASLLARLEVSACHRIAMGRERLAGAAGRLDSLSPLAVLDRGYSITRSLPSEAIVRAASDAPPGTRLSIRVRRGKLVVRVEETEE